MKLLVLATEPIDAADVRGALGDEAEGAEVRVVSPALNESPLAFWVSDSDEAIAEAEEVEEESVRALRADGLTATGETGESEPLTALEDALVTFAAEQILIFAHDEDDEQRYREEDLVEEAERRFSVPVTLVGVSTG